MCMALVSQFDNLHKVRVGIKSFGVKDTLGNHGHLLNFGAKLCVSAQSNALLKHLLFLINRYLKLLWKLSCTNVIKHVLGIYTVPSIN